MTAKPFKREKTLKESLIGLIWKPPLFGIGAAVFFGTLFGRGWIGYVIAYQISLVFAYTIAITMFVVGRYIAPRWFPPVEETKFSARSVREALLYMSSSIAASFLSAAIVHFTFLPGFLGSPRQFLITALFALLFSILSMAIVYAFVFYQSAIDKARSEEELKLARRIQRGFLLSDFPELPGLEVHATNLSSRQVSGDFYDVVAAGPNAWLVAIADVSGKGVPAALLTSMLQASLRTQAGGSGSVSEIVAAINRLVCHSAASSGKFATFFLARVDLEPLRLTYCNAGHNFPVLFRKDGTLQMLEKGGTVVGMLDAFVYEQETVRLEPGDRVVMFTDGVSEAENATGEMYGEERLHAFAAALPRELPARELSDRILADVHAFLAGVEAGDDITLVALRVLEREPLAASPAVPRALDAASPVA